jgi:hypothetical protein
MVVPFSSDSPRFDLAPHSHDIRQPARRLDQLRTAECLGAQCARGNWPERFTSVSGFCRSSIPMMRKSVRPRRPPALSRRWAARTASSSRRPSTRMATITALGVLRTSRKSSTVRESPNPSMMMTSASGRNSVKTEVACLDSSSRRPARKDRMSNLKGMHDGARSGRVRSVGQLPASAFSISGISLPSSESSVSGPTCL